MKNIIIAYLLYTRYKSDSKIKEEYNEFLERNNITQEEVESFGKAIQNNRSFSIVERLTRSGGQLEAATLSNPNLVKETYELINNILTGIITTKDYLSKEILIIYKNLVEGIKDFDILSIAPENEEDYLASFERFQTPVLGEKIYALYECHYPMHDKGNAQAINDCISDFFREYFETVKSLGMNKINGLSDDGLQFAATIFPDRFGIKINENGGLAPHILTFTNLTRFLYFKEGSGYMINNSTGPAIKLKIQGSKKVEDEGIAFRGVYNQANGFLIIAMINNEHKLTPFEINVLKAIAKYTKIYHDKGLIQEEIQYGISTKGEDLAWVTDWESNQCLIDINSSLDNFMLRQTGKQIS